jgi:hypothetical protein
MKESTLGELAVRSSIHETTEVILSSLKQEPKETLGNELLPMKDGNEYIFV